MTLESKDQVPSEEETTKARSTHGIDAKRQEVIEALRTHATGFLCDQETFLQAIEQLSPDVQKAIIESAMHAAAVLLFGRTPKEEGTVPIWRNLIAAERVNPVQLAYEKRLRETGVRAQYAAELVPTIEHGGRLLKEAFFDAKELPENKNI